MNNKEKDLLTMFNELNSMLYEVLGDCNKALYENIELKKDIDWYKRYTDALVEHKNMVCLPADLKNLRESNAALATENNELKKQVEKLKELTIQAWFTDVEEKNKQIDYLLKKVEEFSKPEVCEPQLTDEELDSLFMDKQANPKDIEFDGDELVDSVEEAASKLKSIQEHNNHFTRTIYNTHPSSSGIACPKCGSEFMYVDQNLLLTFPPQRRVQCSKCNHIDCVLA